jgi:KDO2-lipid IV(A) lauroyltransferase
MIRHLRSGRCVAILHDQHIPYGVPINFFGKTAYTGNSAAKLALMHDALLIPVYGVRTGSNGIDFFVEKPINHTDITKMTQEISLSLEARVKNNMDQWIWNHRRWR